MLIVRQANHRGHEVHDRVCDAALQLSLVPGFVATSYDEIAERADVARRTAFNHFPRKIDFISEWVSADVVRWRAGCARTWPRARTRLCCRGITSSSW